MSLYIYAYDENMRNMYREYLSVRRPTDSGVDIFIPQDEVEISAHETMKIGMGIVVGAKTLLGVPAPCLVVPRSSISKTPLRLANSIGLIDAGYRGEILAAVDNMGDRLHTVYKNDRLFQICSHDFLPFTKVVVVENLEDLPVPPDNRGTGGFGSTGR